MKLTLVLHRLIFLGLNFPVFQQHEIF